MIKIEKVAVYGFNEAIRGMRNSWNSHDKSDTPSAMSDDEATGDWKIGENDKELIMRLVRAGDAHAKCMRMVTVWFDLTAPIYFWKHLDTYKHVVKCSESVMHTITSKPITKDDFSMDHFKGNNVTEFVIQMLYNYRLAYEDAKKENDTEKMRCWWYKIIELLPQSYMQKATICTNYQTLRNIYLQRKGHRLDEWQQFREWIEGLPYSEFITGDEYAGQ